jgi:hypothetical protein
MMKKERADYRARSKETGTTYEFWFEVEVNNEKRRISTLNCYVDVLLFK